MSSKSDIPTPRSPRYESLDAWRGFACLAVVLYHSVLYWSMMKRDAASNGDMAASVISVMRLGSIGVPLFFVISGYCIAATADKSRRRQKPLQNYFVRRFRRIFPPYFIVLAASIVIVGAVDTILLPGLLSREPHSQLRPWWFSASQWFGNITLTESWRHHIFGSQRAHFVGQSWTLCYEEQFYAVVGAMLFVPGHRFFLTALLVTVAATLISLSSRACGLDVTGFFFDGAWLIFAAGILVYFVINYTGRQTQLVCTAVVALAAAASVMTTHPLHRDAGIALGFSALVIVLHPFDSFLAKSRLLRPLMLCGTMCYSLYLVHALLVDIIQKQFYAWGATSSLATLCVTVPVCVTISLLTGWAFYQTVESRFLNQPTGLTSSSSVAFAFSGPAAPPLDRLV